jgi:hypothetical protein
MTGFLGIILSASSELTPLPNPPQASRTPIRVNKEALHPAPTRTTGGLVGDYRLERPFSIRFIRRFHS